MAKMEDAARKYQLVLWGATGFTGRLIAAHLAGKESLRWAIAGRTKSKLEAVRAELGEANSLPEIVVCDLADERALSAAVGSAAAVISAAGPYAHVGEPVVKACVNNLTNYCDVTGEVGWVAMMKQKYGEKARKNGTVLVSCCGFDSIPSDLGVLYGVLKIRERLGADVKIGQVKAFVELRGGMSGGTLASSINWERDQELAALMADPFVLGGRPANGPRAQDADITEASYDESMGRWTTRFDMSMINTRIVRSSSQLLGYGPNFGYQEVLLARDERQAKKIAKGPPSAKLKEELIAAGKLPKPGDGPSKEERAKGWFKMTIRTETETGHAIFTQVQSEFDPGYEGTAIFAGEAGILASDMTFLGHQKSGFLTPASAFGSTLIERLSINGIRFEQINFPKDARL